MKRVDTIFKGVLATLLIAFLPLTASAQIAFSDSKLGSASLSNPTSLQFGPDGRLYVAQQDGTVKAFTVVRNAASDYSVAATETIGLIKNDIQNHNDDGTVDATSQRQVTGLLVAGTAANPVLYVSSSDSRIAGGGGGSDANLDTNSGVISRLTCAGGISADECQGWDHVDLVRGLPRSEENHSTNGMDLDEANGILYVMSGGHTNKGAPSNNFAGTPEYYLSGALLSVDLDMLDGMDVQTDNSTNPPTQYVYDLPTLDDPTRDNVDGITDPNDPNYTGIDVNDPFGGNNGLNQAIPEPGGPVQIYSPGYRNPYDVVLTESGDLYTWDNGPNTGWGGQPLIYDGADVLQGVQSDGVIYDPEAGDYCTNEFSEAGDNGHGDQLHLISSLGYYGGHPVPIRAFPDLSGIIVYEDDGSGWAPVGPTYTLSDLLPAGLSIGDFPVDSRQCDYQTNDPAKYLEKVGSSTNGIAEYLGSNFDGAVQGDILAAAFNGNIYRCKPDGAGGLVDLSGSNAGLTNNLCEVLFEGFGSTPLDVTTLGDGAPFPGTVWVANITGGDISVFEPNDFAECDPSDPDADSDGDGFTNGDEADNGTDPCSAASKPADFDGDGVSNLNDPDDDNDGIADVDDPFALDPTNGLGTSVPVDYPFFNTDPGTGLFGLGFTGLMLPLNGASTWLELFDPEQLAAGGTSGLMTVENVTVGDAFQAGNSQENAFLYGVDIDVDTPPVIASTRLLPPYFNGDAPQPFQSFGMFIGTGDQDNYLKVVFNHNNTAGGVEVLLEENGSASSTQYDNVDWGDQDILTAGQVDLSLLIDPQAGTAQPRISLDQGATVFDLGAPLAIPAAWLDAADSQGLAVGIISTANGPGGGAPAFNATWDFLNVRFVNEAPQVEPIADQSSLEGDTAELAVVATDSDGPDNLDFQATGLPPGLDIEFTNGQIFGTIENGAAADSPYPVTITVADGINEVQVDFDWFVNVEGGADTVLHRINVGGDQLAAADGSQPDWAVDTASDPSPLRTEGGDNIFSGDEGSAHPGSIDMSDPSIPPAAPAGMFNVERWDEAALPAMTWALPVTNGSEIEVRLYFAELFSGITAAGQRVFDVSVEGSVPSAFDSIDPFAEAGAKGAFMRSTTLTMTDDVLDLVFLHDVENPALKGIEIIELGGDVPANVPPQVTNPGDQASVEGDETSLQIVAADEDGDTLQYSATGLPDGLAIEPNSGLIGGTIEAAALTGSPFEVEVTVTDGTDPVTIQFAWTVSEPVPSADLEITPEGSLTATTFNGDAFVITNNGDYPITSVSIDLSTALFADNVFDPVGDAGDAGAKCLTPNSGAAATGFVAPTDPCVDPFANPHDGGFEILTVNFADFGPGESFGFNIDVDPTSIKNATGTGDAGAVSGLELTGATASIDFDDGNGGVTLGGRTFQIAPDSPGGSVAQLRETAAAPPSLAVDGVSLLDIDLASAAGETGPASHSAESVASDQVDQTLVITTGNAGDVVRLLHIEASLLAVDGFELEPFEANEAVLIDSMSATTGEDGTASIPVTLTRTDETVGGFNYFAAVVDGPEGSSPVSNFVILRLQGASGENQAPVAGDDFLPIVSGQQGATIDLLANDSDADGVLDASSITIIDPPTQGTLTPGPLGVYEYDHTGTESDSFSYTVDDNDGATSNVATVRVVLQPSPLPNDDIDGDGEPNAVDNDDDNDGFLDTEDPFPIDAENGLGTDLPVSLPMFSDDPGTGLFGLGLTGLMTNGVIGGAQGDDYLDLFDPARIFVDDDPAGTGTLTVLDVTEGDAFTSGNSQQDAFQLGLNVDSNSQPFVVHTRMIGPFFDGETPQDFQSQGMFIGTGDQDNYLKMVLDGASNDVELLLEVGGANDTNANFGGTFDFLAAETVDFYLVVDTSNIDTTAGTVPVDARVALDDGAIQSIATIDIPLAWLATDDDFGLAAGLIATSFGTGPEFDATWDTLEAFHLAADDAFTVAEESPTTALDALANDFDDGSFTIDSVTTPDAGGTAVVNGGVIDYTPAADFAGVETFTYTISDGAGRTATAAVAVTVEPVNDAPSITLGADQSLLEDAGPQTEAGFATGFDPGGGADEAGQVIADFIVSNDNEALFAVQPDIANDGTLSFEPADNANGSATVTVQVRDDGGTANGGNDLSPAETFVIEVEPVNDAPAITIGGDQQIDEDAGPQSVADFATGFMPGGGADEAGQGIQDFIVSNDNEALFAAQPDIANDGTLSFEPAANANGAATVTVQVQDDGGTANGGVDVSTAQTFEVAVNPVNDAPVITSPSDVTIDEDAASVGLAFSVSDLESAAGDLQVTASSSDQVLVPDANIVLGGSGRNRTVNVAPAPDQNGVAVITLTVDDGAGGTSSAPFTLTVEPVNDAPSITIGADQSVIEDAGVQSVSDFATAFNPGPNEAGQNIAEFVVGNDNEALFATQPDIANDRTLTYTPAADTTGSATVTVQVRDDGGTANGGSDLSDAQTFTITVSEQADLSITKTAEPDPVLTGGTLSYTISVDNAGPSTAENVVVTEMLPEGVTLQQTSGCEEDPGGMPNCSLGDIAEGGQAAFTITVEVGAETIGPLVNTVTVDTSTPEVATSNNSASATVEARQAAALEISPASADFGTVLITETGTETFTLTNTGDPITTIALEEPALAADSDEAFSIIGGDCTAGTELVGGEAGCIVEVQFAPDAVSASLAGTLEVGSDFNAVSATLAGTGALPDWSDGFAADPDGFEQSWTFRAFDADLNPLMPATAGVTGEGYLQIRDPDAAFALGYVERTFGDTRTSSLVNADGLGSGSDSGDGLDNQVDQGVIARFEPTTRSGYGAYMRMELDEQQLVLIKFDGNNVDPALIDLRETVATSEDPDWSMGRMYEVELDAVDQPNGSVRVVARALDADSGALLARQEFVDAEVEAFETGFSGVLAIANAATGLNGTFDTAAAISSFASADFGTSVVDFGAVPVGFSGEQTVLLTNNGNSPLSSIAVGIDGDAAADYSLVGDTCGDSLAAGASCSFDVALAADTTGRRDAEVVVTSSASTSPDVVLASAEVFAPELVLDPSTRDFGSLPVGESSETVTFTVSNSGDGVTSLTVDGISIVGDYNIVGGDCAVGTLLVGGESCSVEVQFVPQSVGPTGGELEIETSAETNTVGLDGVGLEAAQLEIDPAERGFGAVTVGDAATASFTLTNVGHPASTLGIAGISITGNAAFDVTGGSCEADVTSLDGEQSCTVDVTFNPGALGLADGALNVESGANNVSAALEGEGTGPAQISLDPIEFDFGEVRVGQPESATFTVTNSGGAASTLTLNAIDAIGSVFSVEGGSCTVGGVLSKTDSCTVIVEFAPLVTGGYGGLLEIESSAGSVSAELTASGLNQVDLEISGSASPQPVAAGTNLVHELTVTNLNEVGDATGVVIASALPPGTTLVDTVGCAETDGIPVCTIGELAAGDSVTVTLTVFVPPEATEAVQFSASADGDQDDPVTGNNAVSLDTGLTFEADLGASLEPVKAFIPMDESQVQFVLMFTNYGPGNVAEAAIASEFEGLGAIEWTCEADPGAVCPAATGTGSLADLADLPAGASVLFVVTATLDDPDSDQDLEAGAIIVEPEGMTDPDPGNNEARVQIRTGVFADGFESPASP
ncbi:MAG: choice-of-anchor D domain-containing protein [Wenzhouxiangellaceae bacterium]